MTAKILTPATGSNIVSVGYDEIKEVLSVIHVSVAGKSSLTNYQNFPKALWEANKNLHSIWVHNTVVGKFPAVVG